ncbi:MAG: zinc finger Ran-binding domain-containing protein, partial [Actinomycetota bacterium]
PRTGAFEMPPPAPEPRPGAGAEPRGGAFKLEGERMLWSCRLCGEDNELRATACAVCGAAFAETITPPEPRTITRDPGTVTLVSLFFPGAGHGYLGLWGQAVARGVTSLWVALMALMLAVQRGPGSAGAVLFTLISFGLWMVSAHDAYREATLDRRSVLLKDRGFMYLVLGLLLLSFVMVFSAALQARV